MSVENLLKLAIQYEQSCLFGLVKEAKIRKLPNGKYRVLSEKDKNLGTYDTREKAVKRLKRVEYFKHFDHNSADDKSVIDLSDIDQFAYSAIVRKLHQNATPEQLREFLRLYKRQFDKSVKAGLHAPDKMALQTAMLKFNKQYKVKLPAKMVKVAAELGNAEQVGKYLSDIVRFTLQRLPTDKRSQATDNLKRKFLNLNETDISSKHLPMSSALGQSITFVKHILFNHDAKYVRGVLDSLAKHL